MTIKLSLAGATGWAGSALARHIAHTEDIELVSAVSRTHAGRLLGNVLGEPRLTCPIFATAEEALERGAHVVIGTSGMDWVSMARRADTSSSVIPD